MNNKQDKKNYKTQIGFSWPSEISLQKPDWGAQKNKAIWIIRSIDRPSPRLFPDFLVMLLIPAFVSL